MELIYQGLEDGFKSDPPQHISRIETIYGEITEKGVTALYQSLNFYGKHFIDIGSGVGKMVIQIALQAGVKTSTGYEILPSRFQVSCQALKRYQDLNPDGAKIGFFLNVSTGETNQFHDPLHDPLLDLSPYDIYFINNLVWYDKTNQQLADALLAVARPGKTVILAKALADLNRLTTQTTLEVEMSWDPHYCLTIYTFL